MAIYPKSCGDKVTVTDYNTVKCYDDVGKANQETVLEQAMDVAILQYCVGVTDIPHDYMMVDAFTCSAGRNNTVCTCLTTSTYCCSGTAGYYENTSTSSTPLCIYGCLFYCCQSTPGDGHWCYMCSGNFYITNRMAMVKSCSNTEYMCLCSIAPNLCFDTSYEALCLKIYFIHNAHYDCPGGAHSCFKTCIGADCYSWCMNCNNGDCHLFTCLVWCNVGSCNWDFYCNGACVCQVTCNGSFPKIVSYFDSTADGSNCVYGGQYLISCICVEPSGFHRCGKISTVPVTWASPVKTVYFTDNAYPLPTTCNLYCCDATMCSCLVSYWKLDDVGSTACDSYGANNGTNCNGVPCGIAGKICTAYGDFAASKSVSLGTPANLSMCCTCCFSISAWANTTACCDNNFIYYAMGASQHKFEYGLIQQGGKWDFVAVESCTYEADALSTTPVALGAWVHVVGTYDGSTKCMKLYVNGVNEGCATYSGGATTFGLASISIGNRYPACATTFFRGKIDEVAFWNCTLTQAQVTELYNSGTGLSLPFCVCCGSTIVYSGTRAINVINATTGLCIACNIPVKCNYLLSCCVCCHKYEIIQCNDAISCVKDYAIVVGM